jgi:alpha-galactosidase
VELTRHRTSVDSSDPASIEVRLRPDDRGFSWRLANTGRSAVRLRSVAAVHTLGGPVGRVRMYCSGRRSEDEAAVVRSGGDDPLRSEMVTLLLDDRSAVLAGFLGGALHDGVLWVTSGRTGQELHVEAFLGGVVIQPGEERELHDVRVHAVDDPVAALADWAQECGRRSLARVRAPQQIGWSSDPHFGGHLSELDVRQNLAFAEDSPLELFELGRGYQAAVGDWLDTNDRFPSGLAALAAAVSTAGCRPGLWLAPFLVGSDSTLAAEHPGWIAQHPDGGPLTAFYDERWGGFVHTLDTSHPEVQDHLRELAADVVDLGFPHLKLDCLDAPAAPGSFHDPAMTSAQRVRAGLDALREGAGDSTVLVGGGAPLGPSIGVVDAMRTGPDVAPWWTPREELWGADTALASVPSVINAWRNTMMRSFMHRRLWINDPGCVLLRDGDGANLGDDQLRSWAMLVAASGGSVTVSDELGLLDAGAFELIAEVTRISKGVDAASMAGDVPVCDDLFDHAVPGRLRCSGVRFEGDPDHGSARVVTF